MEQRARQEQAIQRRARKFDLGALLQLLRSLGWHADEIRFASHYTTTSQGSLVHDVVFSDESPRWVRIVLNLGLLSAQGPLPSYFLKKMDLGLIDTQGFQDFVGYFDHQALEHYSRHIYIESNPQVFPDLGRTKRSYLHLLNLRSCSTLHWLFETVYPELRVRVEKMTLQRGVRTTPLRLGHAALGSDAVFGKRTRVPVSGRRVTLISEEEVTEGGRPWPAEIKQRLEKTVLPILREVGLDLEVVLTVQAQKTWAKLQPESYLGYDKVRGGDDLFRRIKVFSGYLRSEVDDGQ